MGTLTVSVDRTDLSLSPLVFSASDDGTPWGILPGYQMPGLVPQVRTAASDFTHGEVATSWKWTQARIAFDAFPDAASGAALLAAVDEVRAALGRLSYSVTTTWNGSALTWAAMPGACEPSGVDAPELDANQPVYSITIPVYPVGV